MLNRQELKDYRILRGVSIHQVANYCDLDVSLISRVESGERNITRENYKEIVRGINRAYQVSLKHPAVVKPKKPKPVHLKKVVSQKKPQKKTTQKKKTSD